MVNYLYSFINDLIFYISILVSFTDDLFDCIIEHIMSNDL